MEGLLKCGGRVGLHVGPTVSEIIEDADDRLTNSILYIMNSMCSIGYCLNAIILPIVLDYGAMTALCQPTQTDETLYTELPLKNVLILLYCSYVLYYTFVLVAE